jgi:ethanolamine utilization cobalamin adenosyltransferase
VRLGKPELQQMEEDLLNELRSLRLMLAIDEGVPSYRVMSDETLLELARKLIRCDVLGEPVEELKLCGMTADELRQRSHRPQEYYGQAHFMPDVTDGEQLLTLNRVRCSLRHAELMAAAAFADRDGLPTRVDILQAMNRMSSMIWIMMIQMKKEKL